ncbi:MAG TPA: hypothetical protein ENK37_00815 [Oceanithermus profundus]|uniref:Oxidoreductase molybdopterin-binding domain-containing protein n=1 Tax=Oceanithermus profundus TaxID=187137 RepID=A0A7C4V4F2_9DEIN|nr:hypothetical protein [Oceanithermus profundus]
MKVRASRKALECGGMLYLVLLLLLPWLAGCRESPSYAVVREGGWAGAPPAPTGEVLLTLIDPDGRGYDLDRAGLERLTWVRRTTRHHPHESEPPATFEGVLLEQIVDELDLAEEGLVVRFIALDDYRLDRPWADLKPLEPVLALVQDGQPLTVEHYGPVRVILPYDRLKPDPTRYNALWVWQVRVIEFHY